MRRCGCVDNLNYKQAKKEEINGEMQNYSHPPLHFCFIYIQLVHGLFSLLSLSDVIVKTETNVKNYLITDHWLVILQG